MKYLAFLLFMLPTLTYAQTRIQVKNNAASPTAIADIGRDIAASSTEDISPINYGLWANSANLVTLINANTLDIVLNSVTLSNTEAIELMQAYRINRVSKVSGTEVSDVVRTEFEGPSVSVTNQGGGKARVTIDPSATSIGNIHSHCFTDNSTSTNSWLGNIYDTISSNSAPHTLPWDSKLVAMTFENTNNDADTSVEVWGAAMGSGASITKRYDWNLTDARSAVKNNINVDITAGTKLAVYLEDTGSNVIDVVVCLYFKINTDNVKDQSEQWSGDFSGGGT